MDAVKAVINQLPKSAFSSKFDYHLERLMHCLAPWYFSHVSLLKER